ncbi:hypothetical protein E2562_026856 [Oryza meyeriana var. granulata]|uniref:Uncharacterized protein n=1 Tax=Oryza meyeriana var. granulata TaxID=110450 RepID=A0A6G1D8A9_9ORYZ|nr:hypothetical protein E2562_026856 [Oryza meyeriana var. granulata]
MAMFEQFLQRQCATVEAIDGKAPLAEAIYCKVPVEGRKKVIVKVRQAYINFLLSHPPPQPYPTVPKDFLSRLSNVKFCDGLLADLSKIVDAISKSCAEDARMIEELLHGSPQPVLGKRQPSGTARSGLDKLGGSQI